MPICNKHKLCFVHIPKNAGSTIEKALDIRKEESLYKETWHRNFLVCPQHLTISELSTLVNIREYKSFAIVRNPFDRIVSEFVYFYKNNHRVNGRCKEDFPFELKTDRSLFKDINFKSFVNLCFSIEVKERKWLFDGHIETQTSFIQGNAPIKIFKYENIQECFDWLKGITNTDLNFGREKKSERQKYQQYYLKDSKELDLELIETVANFYKEDLENFQYVFEKI